MNKIPIGTTIIQKRQTNKFKSSQMIKCFIHFIILLFVILKIQQLKYQSVGGRVISVLTILILGFLFLRSLMKLLIDEQQVLNLYQSQQLYANKLKIEDLGNAIDLHDGKFLYLNNITAYVVKLSYKSLIGKSEDIENLHLQKQQQFYNFLLAKDIVINKYDVVCRNKSMENIDKFSHLANGMKCDTLKNIIKDIALYIKKLCKVSEITSQQYLILYNLTSIPDFKNEIKSACKLLSGSLYEPQILNDSEVIAFLKDYYEADFIDLKKCFTSRLNKDNEKLISVIKAVKKQDTNIYENTDISNELKLDKFRKKVAEGETTICNR